MGVDLGAEDQESQEAPSRCFLLSHSVIFSLYDISGMQIGDIAFW
jgi:hypothetical protein